MDKHNIEKLNEMLTAELVMARHGERHPNFKKVLNKYFSDKIAAISYTLNDVRSSI